MRRTLAILLALAPIAPAQAATSFDQAVDVSSTITDVTVYPDRAQVTRTAHLDVAPGSYSVRFNRLPMSLMVDSVRVGGAGTAGALLHGFDLKTTYLGQSPDKQVAALEAKVQSIGDADRNLADQRAMHQRQLEILIQTSKRTGDSLANQLSAGKAKIAEWQALLAFMQAQETKESTAIRNLDVQRRTLAKEKAKLDVQLSKLRGFRQQAARQIPVTVEVTKGGSLDLTLEYVVPNASWSPAYDARLAQGEATVNELVAPFRVSQPTISKHLKVLEGAGLVARGRTAQFRPVRLKAEPLAHAAEWLGGYEQFWAESLDRLDDYVKVLQRKEKRHAGKRRGK